MWGLNGGEVYGVLGLQHHLPSHQGRSGAAMRGAQGAGWGRLQWQVDVL